MTSHQGDAVPSPAHHTSGPLGAMAPEQAGGGAAGPVSAALRIMTSEEGVAQARAFTRHTLRDWSLGHRGDDAVLVVAELAANAVVHAVPRAPADDSEVWLGLTRADDHLTLAVSDPGDTPPVYAPHATVALEEHGRGLFIVDALSEEWGWTPHAPAGKTVWARLSTTSLLP
ncbi:ATP-binding protein [Streptomyces sp.]|uniref:ATP-binding protein n=1 Tax=Streptomyces sp. TaxID=1931 RepID=UPI002D5F3F9F|nr:ATP-binding protein [Streptomyces sp.]HZF91654.1 ATP-binding protein [Streptomyces sp.]